MSTQGIPSKEQFYKMKSSAKVDQLLTDKEERRQVFQYQNVRRKLFQIFETIKDDEEGNSVSSA